MSNLAVRFGEHSYERTEVCLAKLDPGPSLAIGRSFILGKWRRTTAGAEKTGARHRVSLVGNKNLVIFASLLFHSIKPTWYRGLKTLSLVKTSITSRCACYFSAKVALPLLFFFDYFLVLFVYRSGFFLSWSNSQRDLDENSLLLVSSLSTSFIQTIKKVSRRLCAADTAALSDSKLPIKV